MRPSEQIGVHRLKKHKESKVIITNSRTLMQQLGLNIEDLEYMVNNNFTVKSKEEEFKAETKNLYNYGWQYLISRV